MCVTFLDFSFIEIFYMKPYSNQLKAYMKSLSFYEL